ncbi:MAG: sensor histidine kinase [Lachnospiraceae bacterium]
MDSNLPKKNKRVTITAIAYVLSIILALVLLLYLGIGERPDIYEARNENSYRLIADYQLEEIADESAPVGVCKVYTYNLSQVKQEDNCLAFYVVHQYVDVYFDDELIYHLGSEDSTKLVKTTGSNWVMIPIYSEDIGKDVRVVVKPVYKNFINWKIDFFLGSKLSIFVDRMEKDMPQIALGILAVLIGGMFCCLALYHYIWKKYDNRLAVLGITAILVGIWRLTDTRFSSMLFPGKPTFLLYISFIMLMLGIIPLVKTVQFQFEKKYYKVFDLICLIAAVSCIIQILLQMFGILDLRQMLSVTHIIILIFVLTLCICVIRVYLTGDKEQMHKHGLFFMCVFGAAADVIAYYVKGNSSGLLFTLLAFVLYVALNGMITLSGYMEQEALLKEQEKELTESRISIMMSQIQPHFLYNSLNTIYHLCGKNPQMAQKAINDFSEYLRGNLDSLKRKTPVPFDVELRHIEIYLSLEKMRFDEELHIVYHIEANDFMIPSLAVQPLVENAVKYGIGKKENGGTVVITTKDCGTYYEISVEDDGAGFDVGKQPADDKTHIGIENVRNRLWTMCHATLTIESEIGKGTKAVIQLPKEEESIW